jgi:hypothetical protein
MSAPAVRATAVVDHQPIHKDWAVYVFMKPDAALERAAAADIEEMKLAATSDRLHLVVQLERGNDIERLVVANGQDRLAESPKRQVAAPGSLRDFLDWAGHQYPGKRRMLILWGHSRGVGIDFAGPTVATEIASAFRNEVNRTQAPASGPPEGALRLPALQSALKPAQRDDGKPFDVIGFDACYMGSLEYACELASETDYLVAAQGYIKRSGWDYRVVLDALSNDALPSPAEFAAHIVDHAAVLEGNTNLSRIDLTTLGPERGAGMVVAFRRLVAALTRVIDDPVEARALRIALKQTSYLQVRQFLDVRDLCYRLMDAFNEDVNAAAEEVLTAYDAVVRSRATGTALGVLNGLSIYCPLFQAEPSIGDATADVDAVVDHEEYGKLAFVKATGWQKLCELIDRRTT